MRKPVLSVLAAASLILSGCGGAVATSAEAPKGPTPLEIVLAAAEKTALIETAGLAMTSSVDDVDGIEGDFSMTMEGVMDVPKERATLKGTSSPVNGIDLGEQEIVMDGDIGYYRLPAGMKPLFGGKSWLRMDSSDTSGESNASDVAGLVAGSSNDPRDGFQMLRAASGDVQVIGKDSLRGAEVTRYAVNLDFGPAAAREQDATRKAELEKLAAAYKGRALPVDVWIDNENLVRKLAYSVDLATVDAAALGLDPAEAKGVSSLSMEFFNFGIAVSITVPAAPDVLDMAELEDTLAASPLAA